MKEYKWSFLRMVATVLIFSCHVGEQIGHVMNRKALYVVGNFCSVGVQVFLILSGYLYGKRGGRLFESGVVDKVLFLKRNFRKILVEYYIASIIYLAVAYICEPNTITWNIVLGTITFSSFYENAAHFWYIPYILFCYLITPLLFDLKIYMHESKANTKIVFSMIIIVIIFINTFFMFYFNAAWICCYVLGFYFNDLTDTMKYLKKRYVSIFVYISIFINIFKYIIRYVTLPKLSVGTISFSLANAFINWGRVFTAFTIFLIVYYYVGSCFGRIDLMKLLKIKDIQKIMDFFDKYSYAIYLVHFIYVKGSLSVIFLTHSFLLNVFLSIMLTIITAILLEKICDFVNLVTPYQLGAGNGHQ